MEVQQVKDRCSVVPKKCNCCWLLKVNLLLFVLVLLGVVCAAVDANWTQQFLSPQSFMNSIFPLASLLLIGGVIILSVLKDSCDISSDKVP